MAALASQIEDDMLAGFMTRMKTQKEELTRLRERVASLEQELRVARTHAPGCTWTCAAARQPSNQPVADATSAVADVPMSPEEAVHLPVPASAAGSLNSSNADAAMVDAAFGRAPSSSDSSQQESILNIIFGEHEQSAAADAALPSSKSTAVATTRGPARSLSPTTSSPAASLLVPKSPPRRTNAKHLSPPTSGNTRRSQPSTAAAPASAGSISDAERMLAQLEDDANSPQRRGKGASKKRKSNERIDSAEAKDADEDLREKTSKFIKVTSPQPQTHTAEAMRVPASGTPISDAERLLREVVQPSQDAYDQEEEQEVAAAAAPGLGMDDGGDSLEYDYGERAERTESMQAAARRARWAALVVPLHPSSLESAAKESNVSKERGNNEFKAHKYALALDCYSQAIRVLEQAVRGADLQPWIQLASDLDDERLAPQRTEEVRAIREAAGGVELDTQMRALLRQLSSVYANRATCHAKARSYFAALTDVNHVLTLQPHWFKGHSIKASILAQQKQFAEAIRCFEQALALPNLAEEERIKLDERLQHLRIQASKAERHAHGGQGTPNSADASQSSAATAKSARAAQPAAQPDAAASGKPSLTRNRGHGTAAQPYEVRESTSFASGSTTTPGGNNNPEMPVHPPSFSSADRIFNEPPPSHSMDLPMRADTPPAKLSSPPSATNAKRRAAITVASGSRSMSDDVVIVKPEPRPRSPTPLPTAAAAAASSSSTTALHAPLSNASNRLSPVPRMHTVSSGMHSPVRPSSASRHAHTPIHDLTISPKKRAPHSGSSTATATRSPMRASPARSPGPPAEVNWFDGFPIITIEGVRDLVGDETFADALDVFDKKRIEAIKIVPGADSQPPKLVGLALKKDAQPRSRRHHGVAAAAAESKENRTHTVSLRFDPIEHRVKEFYCDCRDEYGAAAHPHEDGGVTAANSPPASSTHKVWTACAHIGGVLLVLRKKQEEQEATKPLDWTPNERLQRSMYVTPARRKTQVEMKKEAALRAELEELSNAALSEQLARNHQSKSGTKAQLVARIVENSMLGNLPRCPKCKGNLFYAAGAYHCHGGYDPASRRVLACDFTADRVQRSVWQA